MNYYNEWDAPTAAWLRELIANKLIPRGVVDERSIVEVEAQDLAGFTQCHFFAGIGGWAHALDLAGVGSNTRLWTGSPPCQPFSSAGKQLGQFDPRHLAPVFLRLVGECRPPILFGEQVAAAIGKSWMCDLQAHLEDEDYAVGFTILPACSVGAPHKRDRIFFGASSLAHRGDDTQQSGSRGGRCRGGEEPRDYVRRGRSLDGLAYAPGGGRGEEQQDNGGRYAGVDARQIIGPTGDGYTNCMANANSEQRNRNGGRRSARRLESANGGDHSDLADTFGNRRKRRVPGREDTQRETERGPAGRSRATDVPDARHGGWDRVDGLGCRDGKYRAVEPGTFPLADGLPARVGRLRGYGNAIVPQAAAEFIRAFLAASGETFKG